MKRFTTKAQLVGASIFLILFIVPFAQSLKQVTNRVQILRNEVRYLKWVATIVPDDGYIIGGAADNLLLVSKITQRTILTNGFYVASKVRPKNMIWENTEFYPSFPLFVKDQIANNEENSKLYILDHDVPKWERYLANGTTETYPPGKYRLIEVAHSSYLGRKIFILATTPLETQSATISATIKK